ncbi:hypothetical protein, partial [Streptomyces broussonetiae]
QNTVAEIMAELGLQGRKPPRRRRSLTRPGKRKTAPDLVRRKLEAHPASAPNRPVSCMDDILGRRSRRNVLRLVPAQPTPGP